MTKPNPLAIIVLCIVAISILAFTINDQFGNKDVAITRLSKGAKTSSLFATTNPPHGQAGHRHDLPDGAPLPDAYSVPAPLAKINLPSNNNLVPQLTDANNAALNPAHGQPGHNCAIAVGAPLNSVPAGTATSTSATPSGKNPEHGKPGHRCDIAVGAPLNSGPLKNASTNTTGVTIPASIPTNTAAVGKGLNPAHGQPGHRCDIAVGAPLNSSPAKSNATTSTPALNSSLFPKYEFGKTDSTSVATPQFQYDSTGAALNPAHGQPGHDCAIAVGKPLKK